MSNVPIPPTFADPILENRATGRSYFNPVWIKWFLDFATILQNTPLTTNHEGLAGLLGGAANDHYHFTNAEHSSVLAFIAAASKRVIGIRSLPAGAYTPTSGTTAVWLKGVGGGGAGGGTAATGVGQQASGSGGAGGGYAEAFLTTGFSGLTVALGAAGVAVSGASGGNGGATSMGTVLTATGGIGGTGGTAVSTATTTFVAGPAAGAGTVGNVSLSLGQAGGMALYASVGAAMSGYGGGSAFGFGPGGVQSGVGTAAASSGAGGSGATAGPSAAAQAGGNGAIGKLLAIELA